MKRKPLVLTVAALLAVSAFTAMPLTSCGTQGGDTPSGEHAGDVTITLSQQSLTFVVGSYQSLIATVSDGSSVTWSSSDEAVAKVSKTGKVTATGVGTCTITATAGNATATCSVTVNDVTMTISQTTATIDKGATLTLTATASDDGEITWISSDSEVASVDANGVVTGLKEGTVTITASRGKAASVSCEVTVSWASKPDDYAEITFGEETVATANPGTWYYWNDQGWCGCNVAMGECYVGNGAEHFTYSGNTGAWYSFQIFYRDPSATEGTKYKVSMKINSTEEGDVTITGNLVHLVKGDNNVEVYLTQGSGATVSFQSGNGADPTIEGATLVISDYQISTYESTKLAAPETASFDGKVFHVSAVENASSYNVQFINAEGAVKYTKTLADGDTLDDSTMEDGTYDVRVIAVGSGMYESSDASATLCTYTVSNGGVVYDLAFSGESAAPSDQWVYWTEFAGIENAKYDKGTITLNIVNGGNWYSNQLFYKDSSLSGTGTATMKINSTVAESITINGQVITLKEGDNDVSVTVSGGGTTFSIQFGTNDAGTAIAAGTFVISDISISGGGSVTPVTPDTPDAPTDATAIGFGESGTAYGNPGTWYYWNDQNWCGCYVTMGNCYVADGAATFSYSGNTGAWYSFQIFYQDPDATVGTDYKLSMKVNSTAEGDVTISGTVVHLVEGDNNVEVYTTQAAAPTVSIQAGDGSSPTIDAATLVISDYQLTTYTSVQLAAPTSASFNGKVFSVGAVENASSYEVQFINAEGTVKYTKTLANGDTLDDSTMEDGTYDVKVVAVGTGMYTSSEASGVLTTYTVANGGVSYDLTVSGEAGMPSDQWVYWTEFGGISNAKYDKGTISLDIVNGGNWYSNQLFYKDSTLTSGTYTATMKINSTVAESITINGTVFALNEGDNNISVTVTGGATTFSIQFGVSTGTAFASGTFVISDIVIA